MRNEGLNSIMEIIKTEIDNRKKFAYDKGLQEGFSLAKGEVKFILSENIPPTKKLQMISEYFNTRK